MISFHFILSNEWMNEWSWITRVDVAMNDIDIDIDVAADLRWLSLGIGKVGSIRQLLDIDINMLRVIDKKDIIIE